MMMKTRAGILFLMVSSIAACGQNNSAPIGQPTSGPTSGPTGTPTSGPTGSAPGPQVRFSGRVIPDASGHAVLSWPGATITVATRASQLSVNLSLVASDSAAQAGAVQFFIDGVSQPTRTQLNPATTSYPVPGLDGKPHTVSIVKATEAEDGDIAFAGFNGTLDANGPTPPTRSIEFIGDSITVGFDIEGPANNPNACPGDNYPYASDPNLTNTSRNYAFLTAQSFSADYSVIAYSGRGVFRNRDGTFNGAAEPTVPGIWPLTNCNNANNLWSFPASSTPSLVVINLGTNDFSDSDSSGSTGSLPDQAGFVSTYATFLKTINSKYPNAPIVVTIGPMLSDDQTVQGQPQLTTAQAYIRQAITSSGLPNVKFFAYTPNAGQWTCDYHPDIAEAQIMAQQLTAFISGNVSGWSK